MQDTTTCQERWGVRDIDCRRLDVATSCLGDGIKKTWRNNQHKPVYYLVLPRAAAPLTDNITEGFEFAMHEDINSNKRSLISFPYSSAVPFWGVFSYTGVIGTMEIFACLLAIIPTIAPYSKIYCSFFFCLWCRYYSVRTQRRKGPQRERKTKNRQDKSIWHPVVAVKISWRRTSSSSSGRWKKFLFTFQKKKKKNGVYILPLDIHINKI